MRISRRSFLKSSIGGLVLAASARPALSEDSSPTLSARKFSFLHTYEATGRYWRGIEKAGLIRPTTGIRLVHSPFGGDERRFNAVAKIGSHLHSLLINRQCRFIVDRVCGGSPYHAYSFDQGLVKSYAELLGSNLMGGQVHEAVCNVHNDWGRFLKQNPELATQPVKPEDFSNIFDWSNADRWLEYGVLEDYRGRRCPKTAEEWWKEIRGAFERQATRFGGHFSYCEGSHWGELMWSRAYEMNAAYCIAEVGPWASGSSQFSILSLRGAAKAAGKPWGVFHAPWGPDGCTSYIDVKDWSWQAPRESMDSSGWPIGPEKGPSSALQRRIFFHAYLAGAWTLHEEWGAEGNLLDWEKGTLSPYGLATKDFLDFQEQNPDPGEPYTPIALIHDATTPLPVMEPWLQFKARLFTNAAADTENGKREDCGGAEAACYAPCAAPEIFDVLPSSASDSLLSTYAVKISVSQASMNDGSAWSAFEKAIKEYTPFACQTNMPKQVLKKADGSWVIGLQNPWGARRGDAYGLGSILNEECTTTDTLTFKKAIKSVKQLYAWPASTSVVEDKGAVRATVGPGGVLIIEVATE